MILIYMTAKSDYDIVFAVSFYLLRYGVTNL